MLRSSDQNLNLESLCTFIISFRLCPLRIGQVLRLPGSGVPYASLRIKLTVSEVVGTKNWVNFSLPFLLDLSSIARMQS